MSGGGITHLQCCDCRPRLEKIIQELETENKRLNNIINDIDIENPDIVNVMISAMEEQKKFINELHEKISRLQHGWKSEKVNVETVLESRDDIENQLEVMIKALLQCKEYADKELCYEDKANPINIKITVDKALSSPLVSQVKSKLERVEELEAENKRLNNIVNDIDVENPDVVNVMISAMKEQKKYISELEEGMRVAMKEKDGAYFERNNLVAALARLYPSGIRKTNILGWEEDWHGCCFVDLPTGQISYHYHDNHAYLFKDLPSYEKEWDGHEKETVHKRLANLSHLDKLGLKDGV